MRTSFSWLTTSLDQTKVKAKLAAIDVSTAHHEHDLTVLADHKGQIENPEENARIQNVSKLTSIVQSLDGMIGTVLKPYAEKLSATLWAPPKEYCSRTQKAALRENINNVGDDPGRSQVLNSYQRIKWHMLFAHAAEVNEHCIGVAKSKKWIAAAKTRVQAEKAEQQPREEPLLEFLKLHGFLHPQQDRITIYWHQPLRKLIRPSKSESKQSLSKIFKQLIKNLEYWWHFF